MNETGIAEFICQLRKEKHLTQKQLAEQLNITDKAVSKWERGLSYPDITTLTPLAEILGVTPNELLCGRREETSPPRADIIVQNTLQYADKISVSKSKNIRRFLSFVITAVFLVGVIVCAIVDFALTQGLTWAWYPIAGVVFAWLTLMPLLNARKSPAAKALVSLSIFLLPFLYALQQIIGGDRWLLPLGMPIAVASLLFLWCVWWLYAKTKLSRWYVQGIILCLAIPLVLFINVTVSRYVGDTPFDIWDAVTLGALSVAAVATVAVGFCRSQQRD